MILRVIRDFYGGYGPGDAPHINDTAREVARVLAYEAGLYAPHRHIKRIANRREFVGRRGRIGVRHESK